MMTCSEDLADHLTYIEDLQATSGCYNPTLSKGEMQHSYHVDEDLRMIATNEDVQIHDVAARIASKTPDYVSGYNLIQQTLRYLNHLSDCTRDEMTDRKILSDQIKDLKSTAR